MEPHLDDPSATVQEVALSFDRELNFGARPSIADYAAKADSSNRPALVRELLYLDIIYRCEHGEPPAPGSYHDMLPLDWELIDSVFSEAESTIPVVKLALAGDYRIIRHLGSGAFGKVYLAQDTKLKRHVALKMPNLSSLKTPAVLDRFLEEAQRAALLNHPGIVQIYDFHQPSAHDPTLYFVMEYIANGSLENLIQAHAMKRSTKTPPATLITPVKTAEIMVHIAGAVHEAHRHNLIHRDLKPANILMDRQGRPHVADFGMALPLATELSANITSRHLGKSEERFLAGTPRYMSPEQWSGDQAAIDARSDIWALGAILYEMLAGTAAFSGTSAEIRDRVLEGHRPSGLPSVPRELARICLKCLAPKPTNRYPTALALQTELNRWLSRRTRILRRATIAAVLMIAATALIWIWNWKDRQRQHAEDIAFVNDATERGRQKILQGELEQAFPFLRDAYAKASRLKEVKPDLRFLIARAESLPRERIHHIGDGKTRFSGYQLSQDDSRLFAIGSDNSAAVWTLSDDHLLFRSKTEPGQMTFAAFSRNGHAVVTANGGKELVWDVDTGQQLSQYDAGDSDSDTTYISFSHDGTRFITASTDNTAKIRGIHKGPPVTLQGHTSSVTFASFSDNDDLVVTGSADRTARLWDAYSGKQLCVLRDHNSSVVFARFSHDGSLVATVGQVLGDGAVRIWNTHTGELLHKVSCGQGTLLEEPFFTADDARCQVVVPTNNGSSAQVWDLLKGSPIATLNGHQGIIGSASFNSRGDLLVSTSLDKTTRIWDIASERELFRFRDSNSTLGPSAFLSSDSSTIVIVSDNGLITTRDISTGSLVIGFAGELIDGNANLFVVREDHRGMAVVGEDGKPSFGQNEDMKSAECAAVSSDGGLVAFGNANSGLIVVLDTSSGKKLRSIEGPRGLSAISFTPSNSQVCTVAKTSALSATVRVFQLSDGQPMGQLDVEHVLLTLGYGSNGRIVAAEAAMAEDGENYVELRNVANSSLLRRFKSFTPMPISGAFSPNCIRYALCNADGGARVWDCESGALIATVMGHADSFVNSCCFSPDGRLLATGGNDRTVKIWDIASGSLLTTFTAHTAPIQRMIWTPDGHYLAVGCADETTKIWDVGLENRPPDAIVGQKK